MIEIFCKSFTNNFLIIPNLGESCCEFEGEGAEVCVEHEEEHDPTQRDDSPSIPPSKLFYHDISQICRQTKEWSSGGVTDEEDYLELED